MTFFLVLETVPCIYRYIAYLSPTQSCSSGHFQSEKYTFYIEYLTEEPEKKISKTDCWITLVVVVILSVAAFK